MQKNAMKIMTRGDREIVITREFHSPRRAVWDAMTRPELLRKWLFGPPGWEMTECVEDLRVGGLYRWAWKGPDGEAMALRGEYREVVPHERIVRTETFEFGCDAQAGEQVGTLTLEENRGRTSLTIALVYPSKEARDGALASGMEHGMSAGYDRLEEMLDAGTPA
ncbi:MAG: SRPBCC family protein [Phycisphaeraceae bacterium]|nr:SRPBCC family protein [Phycisphaeraceae bacterium]